jgi:hypothetical protein
MWGGESATTRIKKKIVKGELKLNFFNCLSESTNDLNKNSNPGIKIITTSWTDSSENHKTKQKHKDEKIHYTLYNYPFSCDDMDRIDNLCIKKSRYHERYEKSV